MEKSIKCKNCGAYRTVIEDMGIVDQCDSCGDDEYEYYPEEEDDEE